MTVKIDGVFYTRPSVPGLLSGSHFSRWYNPTSVLPHTHEDLVINYHHNLGEWVGDGNFL